MRQVLLYLNARVFMLTRRHRRGRVFLLGLALQIDLCYGYGYGDPRSGDEGLAQRLSCLHGMSSKAS
jgi:hypothetical protein